MARGRPRRRGIDGKERAAATAGGPPPGLVETPDTLKEKARGARARAGAGAAGESPETRETGGAARRGPGRPRTEELIQPFPVEALAELHHTIWTYIGKGLRSRYHVTKETSAEMARYCDLMLRQSIGPALAENAPLALYLVTQVTALAACLAMREPKAAAAPAAVPTLPERPRAPEPPRAPYESGLTEAELRGYPAP